MSNRYGWFGDVKPIPKSWDINPNPCKISMIIRGTPIDGNHIVYGVSGSWEKANSPSSLDGLFHGKSIYNIYEKSMENPKQKWMIGG